MRADDLHAALRTRGVFVVIAIGASLLAVAGCEAQQATPAPINMATESSIAPRASYTPAATVKPSMTPAPPLWVTEFAAPILADIRARPPDFEDTFGVRDRGWSVVPWCASRVMSIEDGRLLLRECAVGYTRVNFRDYAIEVEVGHESGPREGGADIDFRNRGCWFRLNWDGRVEAECGDKPSGEDVRKTLRMQDFDWGGAEMVRMLLIAKGTQFAFFLNDEPFGFLEHAGYRAGGWYLGGGGTDGGTLDTVLAFDNFRIWDITGLEAAP